MTREELIAFEADIAAEFNNGRIKFPVHLDGGNEDQLIEVFKGIKPTDWVCCGWRSHYRALLHGIPPEKVKAEIMAGHSIALSWPEHRFLSSAIVGGILPIALGIVLSIKLRNGDERVHCFLGDMTSRTGAFYEVVQYAKGFALPITFVVEDNGLSVCTPTADVWGNRSDFDPKIVHFSYKSKFPHSGAGRRIIF